MNVNSVVDISGLNKCRLLLMLARNCSHRLASLNARHFSEQDALYALLERAGYVDYFRGCAIKTDLSGNSADFSLYDRDNGLGRGAKVVADIIGTNVA